MSRFAPTVLPDAPVSWGQTLLAGYRAFEQGRQTARAEDYEAEERDRAARVLALREAEPAEAWRRTVATIRGQDARAAADRAARSADARARLEAEDARAAAARANALEVARINAGSRERVAGMRGPAGGGAGGGTLQITRAEQERETARKGLAPFLDRRNSRGFMEPARPLAARPTFAGGAPNALYDPAMGQRFTADSTAAARRFQVADQFVAQLKEGVGLAAPGYGTMVGGGGGGAPAEDPIARLAAQRDAFIAEGLKRGKDERAVRARADSIYQAAVAKLGGRR